MVRVGAIVAVAALLCLAAMTEHALALNCYVCSNGAGFASVGGACTDPFVASGTSTSNGTNCAACGKAYGSSSLLGVSIVIYSRTCELTTPSWTGCTTVSISGISSKQCYCSTDLCNSAVLPAASATGILVFQALAALRFAL